MLSISPLKEAADIARLILDTGLDMYQRTHRMWRVSSESHFPFDIAAESDAIEVAIDYDHLDMVKLLLSREKEHSQKTTFVSFALFSRAAQAQAYLTLQYLCETYPNKVNEFDRKFSPFYYACRPDVLNGLLRYGPRSHECSISVGDKAKDIVSMLVRAVSDMSVRSEGLFGPFHLLASVEDPEMLRYGLEVGEMHLAKWLNSLTKFNFNYTPLKEATMKGHLDSMILLLKKCASPTDIDDAHSHVLHACAFAAGHIAVKQARIILNEFPSAISARAGDLKSTPLYVALWHGSAELMTLLLDRGPNPNKGSRSYAALGAAIRSRSITGVKVLCKDYE